MFTRTSDVHVITPSDLVRPTCIIEAILTHGVSSAWVLNRYARSLQHSVGFTFQSGDKMTTRPTYSPFSRDDLYSQFIGTA